MSSGTVFEIQHFSLQDGPGIRTTVFLKGCPLRCLWCHNPESQDPHPELSFRPERCIGCGWCFQVCPHGGRSPEHPGELRRDRCRRCGRCTERCYAGALELVGKTMTADEVLQEVLADREFYRHSGGGLTISGGEPLTQFPFVLELARAAKQQGIAVALDTSGYAPCEQLEALLPWVELFLYDCKATGAERHRELTGVDNVRILDNLARLDAAGARIWLRCPLVPGLNDQPEHLAAIADLANRRPRIERITLHPYHALGRDKEQRMGYHRPEVKAADFTPEEIVEHWLATVRGRTATPVARA